MKNLLKLGMALLIAAMLFGITGCFEPEDEDGTEGGSASIDWTNYSGNNAAVFFINQTSENLIAFKTEPRAENLIGGIKKGTGTERWGLKKNPKIFDKTNAFVIFFITEEQYNKNKSNLKSLDYTPFTKLYVFYNASDQNEGAYEISDVLGGNSYFLEVIVPTRASYNVELRNGGITGTPLGFVQTGMLLTKIYLQPSANFNIFPVFHRYNPVREILQTTYPTLKAQNNRSLQIPVALSVERPSIRIDLSDIVNDTTMDLDMGAAYLSVTNQVANGSISLYEGTEPVKNSLGVYYFSDRNKTFEIKMPAGPNQATFAPTTRVSFNVGMDGNSGYKIVSRTDPTVTTFDLQNGKMYSVYVTGNWFGAGITEATIDLDNPVSINYEADQGYN